MIWKTNGLAFLWVLVCSCNFNEEKTSVVKPEVAIIESAGYYNTDHLIEAETLLSLLDEPSIKIIDFRKKAAYETGHIRGALSMWRTDIENSSYDYGAMMASKEQMEILLSDLGVRSSDLIVVYDDRGSCDAARLWWILANYGFDSVKIVNGGLDAWKEIGGDLSNLTTEIAPSNFTLPKKSSFKYLSISEEIIGWISAKNGPVIIDSRTADEFSGKRQKKGAQSGGRIPGSIWIDWADCMDFEGDKKFKTY
ncbi:MAG: hypothetical protein JKY22_09745 [Flavobacteriaceae bacterium]|nr:hypothetical protein [Flavobacteriaceae bacterium]